MMDLTILYYSACTVDEKFSERVRNHLMVTLEPGTPIISITLKQLSFGDTNICCVDFGPPSIYNVYRQILLGASVAKTKYVACVEDDCLYHSDHFKQRPQDDAFIYNHNRWRVYSDFYLWKYRRDVTAPGMWNCIASRDLMIQTLESRFQKYPVQGSQIGWGEPGRYERILGLPPIKAERFSTNYPNLTFAYRGSLGGIRRIGPKDITQESLPFWGEAKKWWGVMWNGRE